MTRILTLIFGLVLLTACADRELDEAPEPIGDFKLGFFVPTTAPELTKGPASREATKEEWKDAMKAAFEPRFKSFTGDEFFHIGAIVEGYVLAQPGIPIVLSPKSALIFRVTVIEDATGSSYPEGEAHQITVLESVSAGSIIGSGLTSTKEEQMANLAANAARATESWMRKQPWFYPDGVVPDGPVAPIADDAAVETPIEDAAAGVVEEASEPSEIDTTEAQTETLADAVVETPLDVDTARAGGDG